jgi:dCTP deaminase
MSVLSDTQILARIYSKKLKIDPCIVENIQPSSIDLTLDDTIQVPKAGVIMTPPYPDREGMREHFDRVVITEQYTLKPGHFILAQIRETIDLPDDLVGCVQNRNSIIRMGVNVGLSSYINPGYRGKLPIAIHNAGNFNFIIVPGTRICQLVLNETSMVHRDYSKRDNAKYHGEDSITLSKLSEDSEFVEYISKVGRKAKPAELVNFLKERATQKSIAFFDQLTTEQKKAIGLA